MESSRRPPDEDDGDKEPPVPPTPPDEPEPPPVRDPPSEPKPKGPYTVRSALTSVGERGWALWADYFDTDTTVNPSRRAASTSRSSKATKGSVSLISRCRKRQLASCT